MACKITHFFEIQRYGRTFFIFISVSDVVLETFDFLSIAIPQTIVKLKEEQIIHSSGALRIILMQSSGHAIAHIVQT